MFSFLTHSRVKKAVYNTLSLYSFSARLHIDSLKITPTKQYSATFSFSSLVQIIVHYVEQYSPELTYSYVIYHPSQISLFNTIFLREEPFFSSKRNGKRIFSPKGSVLVTYRGYIILTYCNMDAVQEGVVKPIQ